MALKFPVFSQIVQNNTVGRGPIIGSNGTVIPGSHRGVDLAVAEGTSVHPVAAGTVVFADYRPDYGNVVVIRNDLPDGTSVYSLYGHLKEIGSDIRIGSAVSLNDNLGLSGHTGQVQGSTGNHVHFEMVQPLSGQPIDALGTLSNYFNYKVLDPKTDPYALLDWDPSRIPRAQLTTAERVAQIRLSDSEFENYKSQLASIETKGKSLEESYLTVNGSHLGRYQLGTGDALVDAGYLDKSGNWTDYAKSQGVSSKEEFLNTPSAQEDALRRFTDRNALYIVKDGLDLHIGEKIGDITVTGAGILMGAHNSRSSLKSYLDSQGEMDPGDGNHFAISNFVAKGGQVSDEGKSLPSQVSGDPLSAITQEMQALGWQGDTTNDTPPSTETVLATVTVTAKIPVKPADGTTTQNTDGSSTYSGFINAQEAKGDYQAGDWTSTITNKDGIVITEIHLHKATGQVDITEFNPETHTETFRQISKEGKLITDIDTDLETDTVTRAGVLDGKSATTTTTTATPQASPEQSDTQGPNATNPLDDTSASTPQALLDRVSQLLGDDPILLASNGFGLPNWMRTDPGDTDTQPNVAALPADQVSTAFPTAVSDPDTQPPAPVETATPTPVPDPLKEIEPYAQGLNSALSLLQAIQQGNPLSAVLAGASLTNTLGHLSDGTALNDTAHNLISSDITNSLGALSSGLNLLDALNHGDTLGALGASANLASQATALWASSLSTEAGNLVSQGLNAEAAGLAQASSEAAALSQTLGQVAGVLGIANSLANGDPIGVITGVLMMNPATAPIGIAISVARAIFGGLFGGDDGEPPYVWINATGDGDFVRTEDGGIGIDASGTNKHKSTESTAQGLGTEGGQAVASALQSLLTDLQSQVAAHNAAHPDDPSQQLALVPERLPELHYRDPAYYAQWIDAASGEARSIAVSRSNLADDLLAVAQSSAAVVPEWLADTITQRIEQGDSDAWRPAATPEPDSDTQSQNILVLGSGAIDQSARSDIDADGWQEAHNWNPANLYLAIDSNGDGTIEGLRDLLTLEGDPHSPNRLGWLDANGDQKLDAQDPGFAALKLWLDANGDAHAQSNETATLEQAGIVAIDFSSYPPQLIDAQGNATALTEAQLSGETKGILTQATADGTLLAHEDGETVLLASRITDYSGDEAHTHREETNIGEGDGRLQSEVAVSQVTLQSETQIEEDDERLKSAAPVAVQAPATVRNAEVRGVGTAPQASVGQELREVTSQMIRDSENLFTVAGGLFTALAFGAGSAQAGSVADSTGSATTAGSVLEEAPAVASTPVFVPTTVVLREVVAETPATVKPVEVSAPTSWTLAELAVVVPTIAPQENSGSSVASGTNVPPPAPSVLEAVVVPEEATATTPAPRTSSPPQQAGASAPANDDSASLVQPLAGDDALDDRTEDLPFRISVAQLLSNDTSAIPTALHIAALGTAEHGRVEFLSNGEIGFIPDADYFGPAAFTYTVANDFGQTSQGRVSFMVQPINDAPVVPEAQANATEDTPLLITAASLLALVSDVDNASADLALAAVANASHGSVALDADGNVRFAPDADYFGDAGFDYTVTDGAGGQTIGHVVLTVAAVNDAPVVLGERVDAQEDEVLLFDPALLLANDADVDNDHAALAIAAVANPSHGTVALDADGKVRFTAEADYFGAAGFDYTVADGAGGQTTSHVDLTFAAVNDAPTVADEATTADEDTVLLFDVATLLANDTDVDNLHSDLAITAVGNASHGTAVLQANGQVRFTPEANWFGPAGFEYTVIDAAGGQTTGRVAIDLTAVNDAPETVGETLAAVEDTVQVITAAALLANDSDVDNAQADLHIVAVENSVCGTVALDADGNVRFTPEADWFGTASFDYVVADGVGGATRATVTLDVAAVNDAPVVGDESIAGKNSVPLVITQAALLANDTDVDNAHSALYIATVGAAEHGTVLLTAEGAVRFTPDAGYVGAASFDYTVADGAGGVTAGHVNLDLTHANVAPTAVDDGFTGDEDVPFIIDQATLLANDTDGDNAHADLHITSVGSAQNGTVVLQEDGSIRFTPTANYYGAACFTYTVTDGDGGEVQAQALLEIRSVNDAPVITGVSVFGTLCQISAYDPDGNSAALTYSVEIAPIHGQFITYPHVPAMVSSVIYSSTIGDPYSGPDPLAVRVTDEEGASTLCWVPTVHVGSTSGGGGGGGGCPIAIDLNHDGVQLVAPDDSNVFADINGDGWRDQIGWVSAEDGLLAMDRDGNGRVDGFDEISFAHDLPGTHTDLQGLAAHDSNGDGYLSAADKEWSRFGIWQDANGNGEQEEGEFRSLETMGVDRIGLSGDGNLHVDQGNVVFGYTTVEMKDGDQLSAADVMFAGDGIAYPDAVQAVLAAQAAATASAQPVTDDAELSRQALAFIQAIAASPVDDTAPLAFVDARDAALPVIAPTDVPTTQEHGVPA